jgi:Arc/MetJ family transcription regulator
MSRRYVRFSECDYLMAEMRNGLRWSTRNGSLKRFIP